MQTGILLDHITRQASHIWLRATDEVLCRPNMDAMLQPPPQSAAPTAPSAFSCARSMCGPGHLSPLTSLPAAAGRLRRLHLRTLMTMGQYSYDTSHSVLLEATTSIRVTDYCRIAQQLMA